jgi:hypothetical protein
LVTLFSAQWCWKNFEKTFLHLHNISHPGRLTPRQGCSTLGQDLPALSAEQDSSPCQDLVAAHPCPPIEFLSPSCQFGGTVTI